MRACALVLVLVLVAACGGSTAQPDAAPPAIDAPSAKLVVTPLSIDFGSVSLCSHGGPVAIDVSNTGGTPTAVTTQLDGTDANEFSVTPASCAVLAPGEHCQLDLVYRPQSGGSKSATLVITAGAQSVQVSLVGVGHGSGGLEVSPPGVHGFGELAVGATSAAQTWTITNGCSDFGAGALTVTPAGSDPSQFVVTSDGCTGVALAPNGSCTVAVAFSPTKLGDWSAGFDVVGNPGGGVSIYVTGSGGPKPRLAITPASYSFGYGSGRCVDASTTFTVMNSGTLGTGPVTVTLGSAFDKLVDGCTGTSLAPGMGCSVKVDFLQAGKSPGLYSGVLEISDGTELGQAGAQLSGLIPTVAGGFLSVNPGSHDFGTVPNLTTANQTFTVEFTGGCSTGPLTVGIDGADAASFSIANDACTGAILDQTHACTFDVVFAPTAVVPYQAQVTITSPTGQLAKANLSGS